jgi:hypothetical protein
MPRTRPCPANGCRHRHDEEEDEGQAGGEEDLGAQEERHGVGPAVTRFAQAVADRVVAPGVREEAGQARQEALEETLLAATLLPPGCRRLDAAERLEPGGHGIDAAGGQEAHDEQGDGSEYKDGGDGDEQIQRHGVPPIPGCSRLCESTGTR